jgi:hypothetical protein
MEETIDLDLTIPILTTQGLQLQRAASQFRPVLDSSDFTFVLA